MAARTRSGGAPAPRRAGPRPAGRPAVGAAREMRTGRVALLLFVALLAIYVGNFRLRGAGDSLPTRLLPFSILREGNLDLDEFTWELTPTGHLPYYVHRAPNLHLYSVSTIATAVVITPLYVVPAWALAAAGMSYDDVRARVIIVAMERLSAATLSALSASLLFLVLCRLTTWRWALGLTLVYALGTSTWSISSQALWAHGLSELALVVLSAVLLAPAPGRAAMVLAGVTAGIAVANRPQMIVFAALALLFVIVHHRRQLLAFAALPALLGIVVLAYNRTIFQAATGGYGGLGHFTGPLLEGLGGLFVSPNRGLFIFTPIMLCAAWGALQVWRVAAPAWLRWLTIGVVLHVVVHAKFQEWWAGYTYGPRYLTDVLPALTLFLVYGLVPLWRSRLGQGIVALLALYGVAVQAIGVYAADDEWNRRPVPLERAPGRVWDWVDLQIVRSLHNGWQGGELAHVMVDAFRDPVPALLKPLSQDDLHSAIQMRRPPLVMQRGATLRRWVWITNQAHAAWPAFSGDGVISARYLTFLLIRWFANGQPLAGVGDVLPLPENVAPGEMLMMQVPFVAPSNPGRFEVELSITQAVDGAHGIMAPDVLRVPVLVE